MEEAPSWLHLTLFGAPVVKSATWGKGISHSEGGKFLVGSGRGSVEALSKVAFMEEDNR